MQRCHHCNLDVKVIVRFKGTRQFSQYICSACGGHLVNEDPVPKFIWFLIAVCIIIFVLHLSGVRF